MKLKLLTTLLIMKYDGLSCFSKVWQLFNAKCNRIITRFKVGLQMASVTFDNINLIRQVYPFAVSSTGRRSSISVKRVRGEKT